MIGIIGAMDEEVAKIVEAMEIERQEDKACMSFKAGKLNGKDVVVVRSGIGKVNAAVCTQILVDDFGVGYPLGQIPRMDVLSFEADKHLIDVAKEACAKVLPEIGTHIGRVVSGDQFISDKAVKERISANFDGYCTEMEGAAIAQAAYLNKVPFVILRAISDKADDSATMDYPTFEKQAIENSVKLIKELVGQI